MKNISLCIPHQKLTVICGVSGSGKSSLAFDTLYAEGQRRYIETFSPYARQFLDRIERPAADRIDNIPPAIAIRQNQRSHGNRSTVGTRTEILTYLRLLFIRAGHQVCSACNLPVQSWNAGNLTRWLLAAASQSRGLLAFRLPDAAAAQPANPVAELQSLQHRGFARVIVATTNEGSTQAGEARYSIERLEDLLQAWQKADEDSQQSIADQAASLLVVIDRIRIESDQAGRIEEGLQTAFEAGDGQCVVFLPTPPGVAGEQSAAISADSKANTALPAQSMQIDNAEWLAYEFAGEPMCSGCRTTFAALTVESLNFNSAIGACPTCEGFGSVSTMTFERVVPDDSISIRDGAIAAWNTPAYEHERHELLALAAEYGIPVDVPFRELTQQQRQLIQDGIPDRNFGGLRGFHRWLVRHRYKMGVRVYLNRWRSWVPCSDCHGTRLNANHGTIKLHGRTFAELLDLELSAVSDWLHDVWQSQTESQRVALNTVFRHLTDRLNFLLHCGLGYLSLNRAIRTLSGGEAQRVMLTAALGSGLINTLYVLDEPTTGLHGTDTRRVIQAVRQLQDAGNTVVVVEHDPQFIMAADEVIEIGPAAGELGGQVMFQGTPEQLLIQEGSPTGCRLQLHLKQTTSQPTTSEPRGEVLSASRDSSRKEDPADFHSHRGQRQPKQWLTATDIRCHNVAGIDVKFPLGIITALTGVSGSGKSSLLVHSLYPALCRRLGITCDFDAQGTVGELQGVDQLDHVVLLDQQPLQRTSRSIPVTWIGAFDDIRKLLAETHEAKKRNFSAGMFSFNSARGGRCPACEGLGVVTVEMQFLADIETTCEECQGRRFRPDVLDVRYRDRCVHEILEMTADEAFAFFNGHSKIQQRLNAMRQAGLGYLRLGQPLSTLSGGESQRLRIAALLAGVPLGDGESAATNRKAARVAGAGRTLFILDEPSTGLHMQDIDRLMTCLDFLVQTGHSVVLIEHDEYLLQQTDWVIEMGPGAGSQGGKLMRSSPQSVT